MYHCHIHFYLVGKALSIFEIIKEMKHDHVFLCLRKNLKGPEYLIGQFQPLKLPILLCNRLQKLLSCKLHGIFPEPVRAHISCYPVQICFELLLLHLSVQIPQKVQKGLLRTVIGRLPVSGLIIAEPVDSIIMPFNQNIQKLCLALFDFLYQLAVLQFLSSPSWSAFKNLTGMYF